MWSWFWGDRKINYWLGRLCPSKKKFNASRWCKPFSILQTNVTSHNSLKEDYCKDGVTVGLISLRHATSSCFGVVVMDYFANPISRSSQLGLAVGDITSCIKRRTSGRNVPTSKEVVWFLTFGKKEGLTRMGLEKVQGCILPKNNMFWDKVLFNLFFGQLQVFIRYAS